MDNEKMIQNRELTMDDYLAMLRRRARIDPDPGAYRPAGGIPGLPAGQEVLWQVHLAIHRPDRGPESPGEHGAASGFR